MLAQHQRTDHDVISASTASKHENDIRTETTLKYRSGSTFGQAFTATESQNMDISLIEQYDQASSSSPNYKVSAAAAATHSAAYQFSRNKEEQPRSSLVTHIDLIEITEKQRPGGEQPIVTVTDAFSRAREDTGRFSEYAVCLIQKLDKDGVKISTELAIRSPIIQRALRSILSGYAFLNLVADPIVIVKPYDALFHYREEIREYTKSANRTDEERRHMEVLVDRFFRLYLQPIEKIYMEEVPKGKISFDMLWTLYKAEDNVLVQDQHFQEIHRVVHCEEKKDKDNERVFHLYTWRWGYNAGEFGPTPETIMIPAFASTRQIEQINCFPLNMLDENKRKQLCQQSIARGHAWKTLIHPTHRIYNGKVPLLSSFGGKYLRG